MGEDFAKSPFLDGLDLSSLPNTLPTDVSMPVEGEETVASSSGSVGEERKGSVKN